MGIAQYDQFLTRQYTPITNKLSDLNQAIANQTEITSQQALNQQQLIDQTQQLVELQDKKAETKDAKAKAKLLEAQAKANESTPNVPARLRALPQRNEVEQPVLYKDEEGDFRLGPKKVKFRFVDGDTAYMIVSKNSTPVKITKELAENLTDDQLNANISPENVVKLHYIFTQARMNPRSRKFAALNKKYNQIDAKQIDSFKTELGFNRDPANTSEPVIPQEELSEDPTILVPEETPEKEKKKKKTKSKSSQPQSQLVDVVVPDPQTPKKSALTKLREKSQQVFSSVTTPVKNLFGASDEPLTGNGISLPGGGISLPGGGITLPGTPKGGMSVLPPAALPPPTVPPVLVQAVDPNLNPFGNWFISRPDLAQGRLKVFKQGGKIALNKKIDQTFIKLLTERFNPKFTYSPQATDTYRELIKGSGAQLSKNTKKYQLVYGGCGGPAVQFYDKPEQLVDRLKILMGSYSAGNIDNPVISNEIMGLADQLLKLGALTKKEHEGITRKYVLRS
jgi:hypothetical protein